MGRVLTKNNRDNFLSLFTGLLGIILPSLAAGIWIAASTARAGDLPEAEWEVVGEFFPTGRITIPMSGGRALLTSTSGPCLSNPEKFCESRIAYLYEPETGLRRVADAPAPLERHFGAALDDDRVLVGGGGPFGPDGNLRISDKCFIYDANSDSWSEAARMPKGTFEIYTNIAASLNDEDGRVIVTGGSTEEDVISFEDLVILASRNVFIFNPNGNTRYPHGTELLGHWEEGEKMPAKMPATRSFATHVPGAFTRKSFPLPEEKRGIEVGRATHHTVVLSDGKVLLIGGRWTQPAAYYGIVEVDMYDPVTNQWTRLSNMPTFPDDADAGYAGRAFPGVSLLENDEVLIFGGLANRLEEGGKNSQVNFINKGPRVPRSSAMVLNPRTNEWRRVGDMNFPRSGPLAAQWPYENGLFGLAIGGSMLNSFPAPSEVYDSSTETWFLLPTEPETPTKEDTIRMGTGLTDGTVLTWSIPLDGIEMRPVKRLHPAGLQGE